MPKTSTFTLSDRMKEFYEKRQTHYLSRRIPVIIRVDGKAHHSYTKSLKKTEGNPYSQTYMQVMDVVAAELMKEIQGSLCAYVQSDEISILMVDYQNQYSSAWFNYKKSKIESVTASIASAHFTYNSHLIWAPLNNAEWPYDKHQYLKPALFDSRSFNIPENEVINYFIWRQLDQSRNSLQMLAQSLYSQKKLAGKKNKELLEMCKERGFDWLSFSSHIRLGRFITHSSNCLPVEETPTFVREREIIGSLLPTF